MICTVGKNQVLAAAGAKKVAEFLYVAVGTGNAAASASDTALGAEVARVLATVTNPTGSTLRLSATFGAGVATGAITEAGLFDAPTGGHLLARQVFGVVTVGASDSYNSTWDIT